jgi:glyoxylase-like metal-dependent hydrolase (beta-lactamase superfamily II)
LIIGKYTIHPIETGRFALDGGAMFGIIPRPLWAKSNPPDERNRIELAARSLLIIGNGKKILVDNGNGSKFTEKQVDIYRLDTTRYELLRSLKAHGLTTDDISDVILTHLHFDHADVSRGWRDQADVSQCEVLCSEGTLAASHAAD